MSNKGFFKSLFGFGDIKRVFVFTKKIIKEPMEKKSYEKVSFDEAIKKLNLDNEEEHLDNVYKSYRNVSYTLYSMFVFLTLYTFYLYYNETNLLNVFVVFTFGFCFLFLNAFSYSFNCYLIKRKELGLLKDFIKSPKNYIPSLKR